MVVVWVIWAKEIYLSLEMIGQMLCRDFYPSLVKNTGSLQYFGKSKFWLNYFFILVFI